MFLDLHTFKQGESNLGYGMGETWESKYNYLKEYVFHSRYRKWIYGNEKRVIIKIVFSKTKRN